MGNRITYTGGSPAATMRQLVDAAKESLEEAAETWHREMLPDHFTEQASATYGYKKRSGEGEPAYVASARGIVVAGGKSKYGYTRVRQNKKYYWQKLRAGHGRTPLVYSGTSKAAAMGSFKVGSTRRGNLLQGYVAMPSLPSYFYKYNKSLRADPIDKAAELTAYTPTEEQRLGTIFERGVDKRMDQPAGGPVTRSK